jgi:hypothetical protein
MTESEPQLDDRTSETSLIRSPKLWALMLASLVLAVPLAFVLNIRFDEAFTLNTTLDGPVEAARKAVGFGQQAPLYFVLVSFWRSIDSSIFFARLFSVLCFPLIVWVAAEVSKRYVKNVSPFIAAAIVLLHQQVVWNALDIRLYAMMTLLAGLLLMLFHDAYLSDVRSKSSRILYVLVAIVSLYTQYYLGFQLFAMSVALLATGRWRALRDYLLDMTIAGVAFLPMLYIVVNGQMGAVTDQVDAPTSFGSLVNGVYQRVVPLIFSVNIIENEFLKRWLARGSIAAVTVLLGYRLVKERRREDVTLVALTLIACGFFTAAVAAVGDQLVHMRHLSLLIYPLVLIPLAAFSVLRNKAVLYGWFFLVVALNVGFLYANYKTAAKPGDFDRVATFVMQNESANQPVLIFHADAILPLRHYYRGRNELVALPQENGSEVWNPRNNILKDEAQVLERINSQPNNPSQFWLVDDGWCAHGTIKFNCEILESVVEKNFLVEREERFLTPMTVRLLRRR